MVIYHNLNLIPQPFRQPVITIGNFDGVHLGHQTLFHKVKERARAVGGQSVVITFDPHPIKLMRPDKQLPLLTTTDQKIKLLADLDLDVIIVHPFPRSSGPCRPGNSCSTIWCSAWGPGRWSSATIIASAATGKVILPSCKPWGLEFGFPVHVVDAIQINDTVVSSTLIRNLIRDGQVLAAQDFLGRPYEVTGEVIRGQGRGARLLGFPTANLAVDNGLLVPAAGIYAVRAELRGQIYPAVANIGTCPTFNNQELSLEVFLMDFDQDIYGERLAVQFVQRLRDEQRFADVPALVAQIKRDVAAARQIIGPGPQSLASL